MLPENESPVYLPEDDGADLNIDQLEAILEASLDDYVEEKPKWNIRSKRQADWSMTKLRRATNEKRLNDEIAEERIREIKDWQRKENAKHDKTITFFEHHLIAYHRYLFAQDPKFYKSYPLIDGKLQNTVGSYSVDVVDLDQFTAYVKEKASADESLVDLIAIDIKPKKTEIAKRCKEGEQFPGIAWTQGEDSFSVKPKAGE